MCYLCFELTLGMHATAAIVLRSEREETILQRKRNINKNGLRCPQAVSVSIPAYVSKEKELVPSSVSFLPWIGTLELSSKFCIKK